MEIIPIDAIPNQSFSIVLDNNNYQISLKLTKNVISCTIVRNGETIIQNQRCVSGTPLIPYKYIEDGNFAFITQNQELPNYEEFGVTQFLAYFTQDDIDDSRDSDELIFNPIANKPLRYDRSNTAYGHVYLATEDGYTFCTEDGYLIVFGGRVL